jgi:hypothetical protein
MDATQPAVVPRSQVSGVPLYPIAATIAAIAAHFIMVLVVIQDPKGECPSPGKTYAHVAKSVSWAAAARDRLLRCHHVGRMNWRLERSTLYRW